MPNPKLPLVLISVSILAGLLVGGLAVNPMAAAVQPVAGQAEQAITAAQAALNTAFGEVMLADLARAPISDLVDALNAAANTLNQARAAFNASDYASAIALAANAEAAAETVRDQAQNRRTNANLQGAMQILITITGVGIAAAVAYLLLTRWRRYQQQRRRDLLRMEIRLPEQPEEEEKKHA
jgi:hypothetical protein